MELPRNIIAEIEAVLADARPSLLGHGGNIELIGFDAATGAVQVRLQGSCVGCPMSSFTLKLGIERMLLERVPGVKELVNVDE